MAYTVLVGSKFDIGQDENQESRVEIRFSKNNLTFNEPIVLSTEGEQQAAEPAMVFDEKRGRLWVFYTTARGKVGVGHGGEGFDPDVTFQTWVTYSDTYGDGWSDPVNITELIKPYDATSAWTPPSEICVAANGELLVAYTWIKDGGKFYHGYVVVSESEKGEISYTRQLIVAGGQEGGNGGGEHQIIQLGDGTFLAMVRDYYNVGADTKGRQRIYRSYDGLTWVYQTGISTTNCKAGISLYSAMAFGDSRDVILVTAPTGNDDSDLWRNNLKLWASTDSGNTWQEFPTPIFGDVVTSTGYSDVAALGSGAIMIAAEGSLYKTIGIRHKAIGNFTGESTFAKSWGSVHQTVMSAHERLCRFFDIPSMSFYFNDDNQSLYLNNVGVPLRLTEVQKGLDVTVPTFTLNSDVASVFYVAETMTINQILGSSSRVVIVSTKDVNKVTLADNEGVPIAERIRINKTFGGAMMVLHRTKYGWYADSGLTP